MRVIEPQEVLVLVHPLWTAHVRYVHVSGRLAQLWGKRCLRACNIGFKPRILNVMLDLDRLLADMGAVLYCTLSDAWKSRPGKQIGFKPSRPVASNRCMFCCLATR